MSGLNDIFSSSPEQLFTPYTPSGNPESWNSAYRPLGLPMDPVSNVAPAGFESAMLADSEDSPLISSLQGYWDDIKANSYGAVTHVEDAVKNAYGGIKDITKTVYGDLANGVGTVVDDITTPARGMLTGFLDNVYWKTVLGVVVIGTALYFIGKTGAVKVKI